MNRFVTRKEELLDGRVVFLTVDRLFGVLRTKRVRGEWETRGPASSLARKLNKEQHAIADRVAKEKEKAQ